MDCPVTDTDTAVYAQVCTKIRNGDLLLFRSKHGRPGALIATAGRSQIPAVPWCHFEMTGALACGGSTSAKMVVYAEDGRRITDDPPAEDNMVRDYHGMVSKMTTASGDAGALGTAVWSRSVGWVIMSMPVPGDFFGRLKYELSAWQQQATVVCNPSWGNSDGVLGGCNVFQEHFGREITAYNPKRKDSPSGHW